MLGRIIGTGLQKGMTELTPSVDVTYQRASLWALLLGHVKQSVSGPKHSKGLAD